MAWKKVPSKIEIAALVVAGLGFVVSLESISTSSIDGRITRFSYTDIGALIAGTTALCLGFAGLLKLGWTRPSKKPVRVGLAVLILALGGIHIARGAGAFASPPEPDRVSFPDNSVFITNGRERTGIVTRSPSSDLGALGRACVKNRSCEAFAKAAAKACPRDPEACNNLGYYIHYLGRAGKVDIEAARAAFKRGCDAGSEFACGNSKALFDPRHLSPSGATQLSPELEEACQRDNPAACYLRGVILEEGRGVQADAAAAFESYSRACALSHPRGCQMQGYLLDDRGEKKDARVAYARGCELEDMHSCWNLAMMTARGQGGARDEEAAKALAERACKLGNKTACDALDR